MDGLKACFRAKIKNKLNDIISWIYLFFLIFFRLQIDHFNFWIKNVKNNNLPVLWTSEYLSFKLNFSFCFHQINMAIIKIARIANVLACGRHDFVFQKLIWDCQSKSMALNLLNLKIFKIYLKNDAVFLKKLYFI